MAESPTESIFKSIPRPAWISPFWWTLILILIAVAVGYIASALSDFELHPAVIGIELIIIAFIFYLVVAYLSRGRFKIDLQLIPEQCHFYNNGKRDIEDAHFNYRIIGWICARDSDLELKCFECFYYVHGSRVGRLQFTLHLEDTEVDLSSHSKQSFRVEANKCVRFAHWGEAIGTVPYMTPDDCQVGDYELVVKYRTQIDQAERESRYIFHMDKGEHISSVRAIAEGPPRLSDAMIMAALRDGRITSQEADYLRKETQVSRYVALGNIKSANRVGFEWQRLCELNNKIEHGSLSSSG